MRPLPAKIFEKCSPLVSILLIRNYQDFPYLFSVSFNYAIQERPETLSLQSYGIFHIGVAPLQTGQRLWWAWAKSTCSWMVSVVSPPPHTPITYSHSHSKSNLYSTLTLIFIAPSHPLRRWPSCYAHTTRAPAVSETGWTQAMKAGGWPLSFSFPKFSNSIFSAPHRHSLSHTHTHCVNASCPSTAWHPDTRLVHALTVPC